MIVLALFALFLILFVVLPLIGLALWALVSTAIVGLVIGALARLVVPGRQQIGVVATILLGLVGSIVGGFVGDHVLHAGYFPTILLEIAIAAVLVAVTAGRNRHRSVLAAGRSAVGRGRYSGRW